MNNVGCLFPRLQVFWEWTNYENKLSFDYSGVWDNEQRLHWPEGPGHQSQSAKWQKGKKGGYQAKSGPMGFYPDTRGDTGRPSGKDCSPPCRRRSMIPMNNMRTIILDIFGRREHCNLWLSIVLQVEHMGQSLATLEQVWQELHLCSHVKSLQKPKTCKVIKKCWSKRKNMCKLAHLSRSCCQAWSTLPAGLRTPRLRKAPLWESLWG